MVNVLHFDDRARYTVVCILVANHSLNSTVHLKNQTLRFAV